MDNKIDVIVQSYGKPWQLLCTLKSLEKHSKQYIDKIFLIEEYERPFNDSIEWVKDHFNNIMYHRPNKYINPYTVKSNTIPKELIRHQWGIEQSNKKHVFICHNDVLFTGNIIGEMLNEIGNCVGIGEIGQCWNCPLQKVNKCSGEKFYDVEITWKDLNELQLPYIRTRRDNLDKEVPRLMPECRLNEFACIIDREICIKEGAPYFGDFDEDSGTEWFKSMYKKGYKFKDYRRNFHHAYWANKSGHEVERRKEEYFKAEETAKQYYKEHLNG